MTLLAGHLIGPGGSAVIPCRRDPLREARHAGYVVSYEQVRIFLGVSLDPGEDLSIVLSLHLTRFNRGKWYQVA